MRLELSPRAFELCPRKPARRRCPDLPSPSDCCQDHFHNAMPRRLRRRLSRRPDRSCRSSPTEQVADDCRAASVYGDSDDRCVRCEHPVSTMWFSACIVVRLSRRFPTPGRSPGGPGPGRQDRGTWSGARRRRRPAPGTSPPLPPPGSGSSAGLSSMSSRRSWDRCRPRHHRRRLHRTPPDRAPPPPGRQARRRFAHVGVVVERSSSADPPGGCVPRKRVTSVILDPSHNTAGHVTYHLHHKPKTARPRRPQRQPRTVTTSVVASSTSSSVNGTSRHALSENASVAAVYSGAVRSSVLP